ncbi:stimulated by retinoic acid gene 6 protein-like isoform X1 [Orbicella faveolata]|uniref:stimulated by retinoic acid gene 6 protein-like isoform X1 n=1 Tax=Orbicella faveolata TaxID=48498 RepID=UPI0009E36086|nr:stimulated by retinoic acid gene 6 protein-like isoform X1 [Orbicella faveolata]
MSYFFFFYNILLGLFSCTMRILKGMLLGVIFISRIDRTSLMQGFQTWDKAFVAYLGFVTVLVAHRHPIMLVFCQLLLDRNKDYQPLQERPPTRPKPAVYLRDPSAERLGILSINKPVTNYSGYRREPRLPRMSQKAFNRWFLAVTLLRNPSLVNYRCQGHAVRPALRLGSINIGDQV